jgi:hypothetical protein
MSEEIAIRQGCPVLTKNYASTPPPPPLKKWQNFSKNAEKSKKILVLEALYSQYKDIQLKSIS